MVEGAARRTTPRCVALDFDGTLVDSNHIKRDAFFAVVAAVGGSASVMEQVLADAPGDRFAILRRFVERSPDLPVPGPADPAAALTAEYTRRTEEAIAVCATRPGVERLLASLSDYGIDAALISATPCEPLEAVVTRRGWRAAFRYLLGGAVDKADSLRELASRGGFTADEIVMVGDRQADKAGAEGFGCRFVAVLAPDNDFTEPPEMAVTDLSELVPLLGLGDSHA